MVNSAHEPPPGGHRPLSVMSNSDVLFMAQLSNDISRSVGGISAVRHHGHGSRAAARKRTRREAEDRDQRPDQRPDHHQHQQHQHQQHPGGGSVKRVQVQQSEGAPRRSHHHRHRSPSAHRAAVSSRTGAVPRAGASDDGGLVCRKCGRTDTPEWRKGPDGGVLCNVCGLVYAKQRRKMKSSRGGTHASQSHHGQ